MISLPGLQEAVFYSLSLKEKETTLLSKRVSVFLFVSDAFLLDEPVLQAFSAFPSLGLLHAAFFKQCSPCL